jgi:hypothetical protein
MVRPVRVITVAMVVFMVLNAEAFGGDGHRAGSAGVSIKLPANWHSLRLGPAPPHSGVVDPRTRIVAASSAISLGRGCNDVDYRFAREAVAIVVLEWVGKTPGTTWTKRPGRFTTRNLPIRAGRVECFKGAGGSAQFVDHGRRFAVFILAGLRAPAATMATARQVLDSLRVARR